MQKILLTDIDDCVVEWSTAFRSHLLKEYGIEASSYSHVETEAYSHIQVETLSSYIDNFNHSDLFAKLPPKLSACSILPKLKSEGWTIIGITACGRSAKTAELRWENMNNAFGEGVFSDIKFSEWYECKSQYLKEYNNCPFIDDNIKHAETAHAMGHQVMIIDRSFRDSYSHPFIETIDEWNSIYEKVVIK